MLAGIEAKIAEAAKGSVLTEMITAESAAIAWDKRDLPQRRAIISALMEVTLLSTGKGSREFDPGSVVITWRTAE